MATSHLFVSKAEENLAAGPWASSKAEVTSMRSEATKTLTFLVRLLVP